MKIAVILGSSRPNGNSEQLSRHVLKGIEGEWIHLREKEIRPIVDQRHTPTGFEPVDDDYDAVIRQVMEKEILLISTPLYWYGMSGILKNFIDRWSQSLRETRYDFKAHMRGKQCYLLITGGDHIFLQALPLIQQFKYIFDFMSMEMKGYILGRGIQPVEVQNDLQALHQAKMLNRELQSQL
jgi:multimeric flavodoxin WrbA